MRVDVSQWLSRRTYTATAYQAAALAAAKRSQGRTISVVLPALAGDLAAIDAVVYDPPRAGAQHQAKQIARSADPLMAAVSCNPVTLARDLRILLDGGYALRAVIPVDQFLWSPHVEAVALLEKPKRRR